MTDIADREWRLIREEARPGPLNMALDEVAAETAAAGGPRTIRLYRWEPSCLSMGYGQSPETVDWDYCAEAGVDVTRRQTGGGGIYHDNYGDISYSITAPAAELPGELLECYHLLCPPILDGFARLGVDANFVEEKRPSIYKPACYLRGLHPAHDVVSDGGTGRKLAGNAQYRQKSAVIQHGSITYDARPEAHLAVFADPDVTPEAFSERVAGITDLVDVSREEAVDAFTAALSEWADVDEGRRLSSAIEGRSPSSNRKPTASSDNQKPKISDDAEEGEWTEAELERAEEIADEKYRSEDWVRERDAER